MQTGLKKPYDDYSNCISHWLWHCFSKVQKLVNTQCSVSLSLSDVCVQALLLKQSHWLYWLILPVEMMRNIDLLCNSQLYLRYLERCFLELYKGSLHKPLRSCWLHLRMEIRCENPFRRWTTGQTLTPVELSCSLFLNSVTRPFYHGERVT